MNNVISQLVRLPLYMLLAVCAIGSMGGCQDGKMEPGAGRPDPIDAEAYPTIVALEGLDKYLVFGESIVRVSIDQPMRIVTPVRAKTDKELSVQYRFQFFDVDRALLHPAEGWRHKRLMARADQPLEGAALDTNAVYWRLQVRPAR